MTTPLPNQVQHTLTPDQRGLAEQAFGSGQALLQKLQSELRGNGNTVLLGRPDGIVLVTLLAQLPNANLPPVKQLIDELCSELFPDGGTVIHFPPT